ncbi:MAG: CDP-alcohol phosphatidyltransferase family protein [Labilithrix sp.]|nr:CDP-alcohol phosphatidyltransferase family protein [Labilithrix sp.]MBX3211700.1 CDP-alcohol phosphatidyltransferase family protein [Labilithrix sp.]
MPPSADAAEASSRVDSPLHDHASDGRDVAEQLEDVSGVHVPSSVVDSIIESTTDPLNRFYRYPAARALLPILGRIPWLTPNHVTYTHIAFGLAAAALVALTEGRGWLVLAFVLCEVRMILDCFDGVLARARGTSSPFGRALDEIADTIAVITLACAMTYRLSLGTRGVVLVCAMLACGGLSANAWDFYKRKLTFALREGKDGVLDEIRHKKGLIESGKGTFLGYWGVYFDCFQVLLYEVRPKSGDAVGVIRARANDPQFRRFASLLSFLSFDNGLGILHVGALTGLFLQAEVFALGYAVFMWTSTMVLARMVLRTYPSPESRRSERTP